MTASLLLSRVLGIVRDAVIAGMFGSNEFTDAYRLAFSVPDLLFFLIAGGALSSAFIPVFSEYLHTNREKDAWHVFSVVATLMSILVVTFIVAAWIFALPLSRIVAPGKPDEILPLIAEMSRIILPAQYAFFIGGLMFGTLYSRQVFTVPGLGPNIYNLGIIFGAVALSWFFTPGVVGMSWGALGGAVIGNLVIPYFAMRKIGLQFHLSLDLRHPGVRKVFRLMLPVVLGLSLPGVYGLITQAMGSFFEAGTNTALDFANKLMQAPLGVFGQSLAIAVFPALTQFFAQQRMDLFRGALESTMRTVIAITVPISVVMMVMAPQIVGVVYQHGAFDASAAAATAEALRLFSIGVSAWCLHPVLMRAFFSVQQTVLPIVLGTVTTVVFVGLIAAFWQTPLGYLGLPLASSLSAVFLVVVLSVSVSKKIGGLDFAGLLTTFGKSVVASVPVALICGAVAFTPIADRIAGQKLPTVVATGIAVLLAGWAFSMVAHALKMPEAKYVDRAAERFRRKRKSA